MSPHDQCSLYLEELLCCLKQWDDYSVVGHICYPQRWPRGENVFTMRYEDFAEQADALLRHIIQSGHGIEVNTSMYRKLGKEIPGRDWLTRYRELGGDYVTFGSDAHFTEHMAYRFDDAVELVKAAGIRYYATYEKRKPAMHRL
ncbi:Histidinol-phosphatase [bioreactor metagenome]|uniref:Histidinol-phosphatase n=1 Tax=bioreactor metagenome TaxID=1076179 RepID=A0A645J100_9ZZZZ